MMTVAEAEAEDNEPSVKRIFWIGNSRDEIRQFPDEVKYVMGFALYQAQIGGKHVSAKPLKGFGGAGVLEIVEDHDGNTYRGVYTVKLAGAVYVLDAFQKKSKTGSKTPQRDMDRLRKRLKAAEVHHGQWRRAQFGKEKK